MGIIVDGRTYTHLQEGIMLELECLMLSAAKSSSRQCVLWGPTRTSMVTWLLRGGSGDSS